MHEPPTDSLVKPASLTEGSPAPEHPDAAAVHHAPPKGKPPVRPDPTMLAESGVQPAPVDPLSAERVQELQRIFKNVDRNVAAKMLAERGVPEEHALKILESAYGIKRDAAQEIVANDETKRLFDENKGKPAPETQQEQAERHEMEKALKGELGAEAERIMKIGDEKERKTAVDRLHGRLAEMFGPRATEILGRVIKYSAIGFGIFGLLFLFVMRIYGGGSK